MSTDRPPTKGPDTGRATAPAQELRDLAFTALGLGIMTFQRLQVRRRQLEEQLAERWFTATPR